MNLALRKYLMFYSVGSFVAGLVYLSLFNSLLPSVYIQSFNFHDNSNRDSLNFVENTPNSFSDGNITTNATVPFDRKPSYPWKGDPKCQHFVVQVCLSKFQLIFPPLFIWIKWIIQLAERDSLPKWALTSFPGSGVTWTRQLIEGKSLNLPTAEEIQRKNVTFWGKFT